MAQINTELIFTEEFTDTWFMVKLFYDGGVAYNSPDLVDMKPISEHSDKLLQSAGIGFGWEDGEKLKWVSILLNNWDRIHRLNPRSDSISIFNEYYEILHPIFTMEVLVIIDLIFLLIFQLLNFYLI